MDNKGYFMTLWLFVWNNAIKHSVTYKLLCGIYAFFSSQWNTSRITNFFRRSYFVEETVRSSIFGRILFKPFNIIEKIQQKHLEKLVSTKEHSRAIKIFNYLLHNILALNLRYIGVLMLSASLTVIAGSLLRGWNIILPTVFAVLGAVLCFFNVNGTEYLSESAIVKAFEHILDTKFSFNFFYLTKCNGKSRLVWAVVFGIIAGIPGALIHHAASFAFIAGIFGFSLILYKVEFGLFITIFLAPLLPTMAVVGLCGLCLFSLIIKALTTKKFVFRTEGIGLTIILMLAVYLFSSLNSYAMMNSLQIFAVYFVFMVFYFVVINIIKTKKQLFDLLKMFVLAGLIVCLYGVLQYVFDWNISQAWMDEEMFSDIKMRIYSTLENPNVLGEYILLVLPVCVALAWTSKKPVSKVFYSASALIMGAALIFTFSRGCWLGFIASAAVFITFVSGKLWGLALVALPLLPIALPENILNRFTSIGDLSDTSTSYRVFIWLGTLLMLKDFWMSGVGLGTEAFNQVYPTYAYSAITAPHSHNLFLQITAESGVVGIAVFLFLCILFLKRLIEGYQCFGKGNKLSIVMVAIGSALLGFLLQGMFDNCFYNYRVFMIFWSVIAMGVAGCNVAKNESAESEVKKNA